MAQTFDHVTIANHLAVIQAHNNQPIIDWVVDTGALKKVAIFIQRDAHNRVANIMAKNWVVLVIVLQSIIHFLIVSTTSQPAIMAPDASNIAAIIIAQPIVSAFDQTAGHILLATSLAHIFTAIYSQNITPINKNILVFHQCIKYAHVITSNITAANSAYLYEECISLLLLLKLNSILLRY